MDLEKRIDGHDRQFALHEKRMERIDKRLDATAKLVQAGMKLIAADRKKQKESNENFEYRLNALIHSQQQTGEQIKELTGKMDRFIDELRRGNRNGHSS